MAKLGPSRSPTFLRRPGRPTEKIWRRSSWVEWTHQFDFPDTFCLFFSHRILPQMTTYNHVFIFSPLGEMRKRTVFFCLSICPTSPHSISYPWDVPQNGGSASWGKASSLQTWGFWGGPLETPCALDVSDHCRLGHGLCSWDLPSPKIGRGGASLSWSGLLPPGPLPWKTVAQRHGAKWLCQAPRARMVRDKAGRASSFCFEDGSTHSTEIIFYTKGL